VRLDGQDVFEHNSEENFLSCWRLICTGFISLPILMMGCFRAAG
jgi:hypothetical protein